MFGKAWGVEGHGQREMSYFCFTKDCPSANSHAQGRNHFLVFYLWSHCSAVITLNPTSFLYQKRGTLHIRT